MIREIFFVHSPPKAFAIESADPETCGQLLGYVKQSEGWLCWHILDQVGMPDINASWPPSRRRNFFPDPFDAATELVRRHNEKMASLDSCKPPELMGRLTEDKTRQDHDCPANSHPVRAYQALPARQPKGPPAQL